MRIKNNLKWHYTSKNAQKKQNAQKEGHEQQRKTHYFNSYENDLHSNKKNNNKKKKTLTDTTELVEHAITSAVIEENSAILQNILKWNQV